MPRITARFESSIASLHEYPHLPAGLDDCSWKGNFVFQLQLINSTPNIHWWNKNYIVADAFSTTCLCYPRWLYEEWHASRNTVLQTVANTCNLVFINWLILKLRFPTTDTPTITRNQVGNASNVNFPTIDTPTITRH